MQLNIYFELTSICTHVIELQGIISKKYLYRGHLKIVMNSKILPVLLFISVFVSYGDCYARRRNSKFEIFRFCYLFVVFNRKNIFGIFNMKTQFSSDLKKTH